MTVTTPDGTRYIWRPGACWIEVRAPGGYERPILAAPETRSVEALLGLLDRLKALHLI